MCDSRSIRFWIEPLTSSRSTFGSQLATNLRSEDELEGQDNLAIVTKARRHTGRNNRPAAVKLLVLTSVDGPFT
jgi:hypothetical protein